MDKRGTALNPKEEYLDRDYYALYFGTEAQIFSLSISNSDSWLSIKIKKLDLHYHHRSMNGKS